MKKIEIVHILDSLCVGGMENLVIGLCNNIDHDLFNVTLLVLSNDKNEMKKRLSHKVKLIELPLAYNRIMNILYIYILIPYLYKNIKRINAQIVHTHCYQFRLTAILLPYILKSKNLLFFHTLHTAGLHYQMVSIKSKFKLVLERYIYKLYNTHLIAVSELVYLRSKEVLQGSYASLSQIDNGVNIDLASIPKSENIYCERINFVYVSRLHSGKNHILLLEAFSKLLSERSDVHLYLIGEGNLRFEIEKKIDILGIKDYVTLLGNRDDVYSILKACDIGVFPSLFEGLSLALLEMLAAGLPVVCSDIPEFVRILKKSDALFFNPYSSIELYEKMRLLCNNSILRTKFSSNSLRVSKMYSLNEMSKKYKQEYLLYLKH